jgi:hypothetical protein
VLCPTCRTSLPESARFCLSCGHQFIYGAGGTLAAGLTHPTAAERLPGIKAKTGKPRRHWRRVLALGCGITVLLMGGFVALAIMLAMKLSTWGGGLASSGNAPDLRVVIQEIQGNGLALQVTDAATCNTNPL